MTTKHDRINDDLAASEVNEILNSKFGISLFCFAQILAYGLDRDHYSRYATRIDESGVDWAPADLNKVQDILRKLRRDIFKRLFEFSKLVHLEPAKGLARAARRRCLRTKRVRSMMEPTDKEVVGDAESGTFYFA